MLAEIYYNCEEPVAADLIFDAKTYYQATLYVPDLALEKVRITEPWRFFKHIEVKEFNYIEDVAADTEIYTSTEIYNLAGLKVASTMNDLSAGVYLIRQNGKVYKIAVK